MYKKSNLAPFIDLFSILAIGLLVLMTVTAGTDKPIDKKPSYTIVKLYLTKPKEFEIEFPGIPREKFIKIDPYYLLNGNEVPVESLSVTTTVNREPDAITVMIIGNPENISVGFRVTDIVMKKILMKSFGTEIVAISNNSTNEGKNEEKISAATVGMWIDPIIHF